MHRYFSSFGRTPSSGMKAAQSFIHEAPGVSFIYFFYLLVYLTGTMQLNIATEQSLQLM